MHNKAKIIFLTFALIMTVFATSNNIACAQKINISEEKLQNTVTKSEICNSSDRPCIIEELTAEAAKIDNNLWRDQTYREIAKTLAFEGDFDKAIHILDLVEVPDTKAMTIRGIGMMLSVHNNSDEEINKKFATLRIKADEISDPPSNGIALTYIAMAQAFANQDEGAWKTIHDMKNLSLKNKAYGETAEIQAERGDFKKASISINKIEDQSYRNKAFETISKILADNALYNEALKAAYAITNPYKKSVALQYVLDQEKPRDRIQKGGKSD